MKLACKDLNPATTCDFEVEGAAATDAAHYMLIHAREVHAGDIEDMTDEDALKMMESKVRE